MRKISKIVFTKNTRNALIAIVILLIIGFIADPWMDKYLINTIYWPIITGAIVMIIEKAETTDKADVQSKIINDKLDKIISYYTSKEEIINQAKQNKELYDLNLIDFNEYELNRLELKNRLKESNN